MAKRELKPKFVESSLGKNPFLGTLNVVVSEVEMKHQYKKDKDGIFIPVIREAESDTSTRIFNSAERRLKMCKLSSSAKGLLLWLIYEADNGKEYIWINRPRYQEENSISSPTTYRTAINELISECWVIRTKIGGVYWINPSLFFNGSRISKFPKNLTFR